jgi:hypothetical protein
MTKKQKRRSRVKVISFNDPRIAIFLRELKKGSARAAAIVGHVYVHGLLQKLLLKRLVEDKDSIDKINNLDLSKCVRLCYLAGAISKEERAELNAINEIRNDFAHDATQGDFIEKVVSERCNSLKLCEQVGPFHSYNTPRERYISTVLYFIWILPMRGEVIDRIGEYKTFST